MNPTEKGIFKIYICCRQKISKAAECIGTLSFSQNQEQLNAFGTPCVMPVPELIPYYYRKWIILWCK